MDKLLITSIFPYILPLLIILVPLFLFLFMHKPNANALPAGSGGLPVVGEIIKFISSGPQQFIEERTRKYSEDVFKTSLFGQNVAVFCGPQGNKFLFANEAKVLTAWWPLSVRKALLFPEFTDSPVNEVSAVMHSFVGEILKPEALKQYIPVMDSMAREHVEMEWVGHEVVKVFSVSMKYTFDLACRIFMNVVDEEHVTRLAKYFALVTTGLFAIPINLPGTAYNRGIKGGILVREELLKIITERRKEMLENTLETAGKSDLLSRMLLFTDENGNFVSEKVICNNIIGLLFASYETTSDAVSFALKYIAELPDVYDKVYKEQMEIAKSKREGELLTWEDIKKMKYSWNVVCETLRLIPPGLGGFREVVDDFKFAGFTIPKGWKTLWTVHSTHKNPKYFANPEIFDPSRFEGKGPAPYTYVPFGGGSRMCPGKEYARLQVLVFLHNIVTKFRLEKVNPEEKIVLQFLPFAMEGLPIRLIPHEI